MILLIDLLLAAVQKHARVTDSEVKIILSEYLKQAVKRMKQDHRLMLLLFMKQHNI